MPVMWHDSHFTKRPTGIPQPIAVLVEPQAVQATSYMTAMPRESISRSSIVPSEELAHFRSRTMGLAVAVAVERT